MPTSSLACRGIVPSRRHQGIHERRTNQEESNPVSPGRHSAPATPPGLPTCSSWAFEHAQSPPAHIRERNSLGSSFRFSWLLKKDCLTDGAGRYLMATY